VSVASFAKGALVLLLAVVAGTGCSRDPSLYVDLRSDFVPRVEVTRAVTYVRRDGVVVGMAEKTFVELELISGVRVAEFDALPRGSYTIAVELFGPGGATVWSGRVLVEMRDDLAVTVVAPRQCRGADPTTGCDAPPCTGASDCDAPAAACAQAVCMEGDCLAGAIAGECGADEACVPDVGCVAIDGVPMDGGPATDSGPAIDSGPATCPGECAVGARETGSTDCGDCGSQDEERACGADCRWGPWEQVGSCGGEGRCSPGDTADFGCGACGRGTWTCRCQEDCNAWMECTACVGDVSCLEFDGSRACPGEIGFRDCPTMPGMGEQRCTCTSGGTWASCAPGCT
jgi:hypothetical protein